MFVISNYFVIKTENLQQFKFLYQYFGQNPVKFTEVLQMSISSVEEALTKIEKACEQQELKLLKEGFHTLKGNLTLLELGELLKRMPSYENEQLYHDSQVYQKEVSKAIADRKSLIV